MAEETMPVTEAGETAFDEMNQYELAFHILPTVTDEEVAKVCDEFKTLIERHKGAIVAEETPQRYELAYSIKKMVEGRYQRFETSFFGWMRFTLQSPELSRLTEEIKHQQLVLRSMIVRLTRAEVAQPFRVFEKRREPVIVGNSEGDEKPAESEEALEQELDESLTELTNK